RTPPSAETSSVAVAISPAWLCDSANVAAIAVSENEKTMKSKASSAQPSADAQKACRAGPVSVRYHSRLTIPGPLRAVTDPAARSRIPRLQPRPTHARYLRVQSAGYMLTLN